MKSVWTDGYKPVEFGALKGDVKTRVLIIGGGLTGVLCAYFLHKAGVDYILAEGNRIGMGVTKNTTAKITSQHGLLYDKLLKSAGADKAKKYLEANQLALMKYKEICRFIDCDFEEKSAFIYSVSDRKAIENEVTAVNKLGLKARFAEDIPVPVRIAGAIEFEHQAQFNPLKFIGGISKGLNIFENTFVKELIGNNVAVTDGARIKAEKIIVASHFPFLNKHGGYFLKMYQHRSYVVALENAADVNGMYLEDKEDGLSFRNYKNLLFIGGGDHKTGKKGGNLRVLREFAKSRYPKAREKYAWATQDCVPLDDIPYIGRYAQSTQNLYVATGFNKWGMTSAMVSALILSETLTGKRNPFAEVFSPQRSMLKPRLFSNGLNAAAGLLTPSLKRCPHMGCALKWNPVEKTWDCSCHGSRFEKDGALIDNPATGNLKGGSH